MLVWTNLLMIVVSVNLISTRSNQKILLLLIDGCRWDYPDTDDELKGFLKLSETGVRAEYVTPIFPSVSYPNWYTLVTGRYAENHGFVQNSMYDIYYKDFFFMGPHEAASVPHWWNHAEPIWITAEKNNLTTYLFEWDGCQVKIKGTKPKMCTPYVHVSDMLDMVNLLTRRRLLLALDQFKLTDVKLVQVYYELIDYTGHKYGPDSEIRKAAFRNIDSIIYEVQEEIVNRGLEDEVNFIVVSDHGMTFTSQYNLTIMDLRPVIDPIDVKYMIGYGPTAMILPEDGKIMKVYKDIKVANMTGLHTYLKEEIPDIYRIKNIYLTLPILLVAEEGYYIRGLSLPGKSIPSGFHISKGTHGYDPYKVKDMRTIFLAKGPGFKKGYMSPPIENVDPYNLMCHLLEIEPLPNDGSWERVRDMLQDEKITLPVDEYISYILSFVDWLMTHFCLLHYIPLEGCCK